MNDLEFSRAKARVLELLEQRHGVGVRGERVPSWFDLRLGRALERLRQEQPAPWPTIAARLETDAAALSELADLLRVGETHFYRDSRQWKALADSWLPGAGLRLVRAASIGCSTGEEAFTLAMLLDDAVRRGLIASFSVLALDRSEAAVERARAAEYSAALARHLPDEWRERYLVADGASVRVRESLRARVALACRDLMSGLPAQAFELIVCKNVLLYFGAQAEAKALAALSRALAPNGVLVVARSEVPRLRRLGFPARELAHGIQVFGA